MAGMLDGPRRAPRSGGAARQLVVLLHGLGADGQDLIELAPLWAQFLPDAEFVAPDAPFACDMAPFGRQWFSVQDRSAPRITAGVAAALPRLDAFLDAELARLGLPASAAAVAGFSQGAMMTLAAGLPRRPPLAALLAYSGRLVAPLPDGPGPFPPVLLVHGEADDVVPVEGTRQAESRLRQAGLAVEALYRPGLGHGIDEEGLAAGAALLRRVFGAG